MNMAVFLEAACNHGIMYQTDNVDAQRSMAVYQGSPNFTELSEHQNFQNFLAVACRCSRVIICIFRKLNNSKPSYNKLYTC